MSILNIFKKKSKESPLEKLMKKGGFETQKEFAEFLGISESLLSRKLNGRQNFGAKTAIRVHEKTSIPLKNLIQ